MKHRGRASMGPQPMRAEHARTLEILLSAARPLTQFELGRASGRYRLGHPSAVADLGRYLAQTLIDTGAVAREGRKPARYDITERGRIALAIWRTKEAKHVKSI